MKDFMDKHKNKFPQDAPVFGKPNVIINPQKYENNKYTN